MNYLESVKTLLTEHLGKVSTHGQELLNCSLILDNGDYTQRVYDFFFNLIIDPAQSPESILHLLDTYISGLDGFSTNKSIQTMVSFPCIEALARRRPEVLEGPWEKVAWIIINYSALSNTIIGKTLASFKTVDVATLKWIIEYGSTELCPNPCLRLELFRLMRCFNFHLYNVDYDLPPFRDKVINTLFEVYENYTSFTINQLPNFSPMDLQFVIKDNNISMRSIMTDCDLYLKRSDIIVAVLKLTRILALLEQGRQQKLNNQAITVEVWNIGIKVQLSACLSFCGLIPLLILDDDLEKEYNACLLYFVQAIGNDPFLLNYVIFTLDKITQVSLCFPDEHSLHDSVMQEKDKLLHGFFKGHISQLPTHQYRQEIYGGFTPAAEYRLRYFQNTTMDQYNDSETDSECYPNENDYGGYASEENNSELYLSDE